MAQRSTAVSPAKNMHGESIPVETPLDRGQLRRIFDAFMALCRANTAHKQADHASCMTAFHSVVEPGVSLADYLMKLESQVKFGDDCVFVAFMLIGRYTRAGGAMPSTLSAHRLCVAALRVATKLQHDLIRSNRTFARFGGLQLAEMNYLESQFLTTLGFNLWFTADDFAHVKRRVLSAAEATVDVHQVARMADALNLDTPAATPTHFLGTPALSYKFGADAPDRTPEHLSGRSPESLASPHRRESTTSPSIMSRASVSMSMSHRGSLSTVLEHTAPPGLQRRRTSSISTAGNMSMSSNPVVGGNGFAAARTLRGNDSAAPAQVEARR